MKSTYISLQCLDSVFDSEWNAFLATKTEDMTIDAGQQFVTGTSILIRKWSEKVDQYE